MKIIVLLTTILVIALDWITKTVFETPETAMHHRATYVAVIGLITGLLVLWLVYRGIFGWPMPKLVQFFGAVLAGGGLANSIDLIQDGVVSNPLLFLTSDFWVAFNVGDAGLILGGLVIVNWGGYCWFKQRTAQ